MQINKSIKFIDLFAGIGGIRKGFELACSELGIQTKCVLTSEIKPYAIDVLKQNHPEDIISGDITKIDTSSIEDFDFLLGGFPCQAFSAAGKRLGFEDTRGTLFFEVERILRDKKPKGFILENVEGLVNHDKTVVLGGSTAEPQKILFLTTNKILSGNCHGNPKFIFNLFLNLRIVKFAMGILQTCQIIIVHSLDDFVLML